MYAKIGDVIKFEVICGDVNWKYLQINLKDADGNDFGNTSKYAKSYGTETKDVFEWEITSYDDLKKIRTNGFKVQMHNGTIESIKLLSFSDSYGYMTITIGDTGYATWSSDKNYDFKSAGIQAYYASAVDKNTSSVTLTPKDITWNWCAYMLKAAPGDYDVVEAPNADGSNWIDGDANYLKQCVNSTTVTASTDGKYHYIFGQHNETKEVGFFKLEGNHVLAANKAYLETTEDISPASARVALIFEDDSETTGIKDCQKSVVLDNVYYNLNGVRVAQPTKGLYIVNGKKVVIK